MDEDDIKKHKNDNHIGCDLDAFSLDELEDYIGDLVKEIDRVKKMKYEKSKALDAANNYFN